MRTLIIIKTSYSDMISFNTFPCLHFIRITLEINLCYWYLVLLDDVLFSNFIQAHTKFIFYTSTRQDWGGSIQILSLNRIIDWFLFSLTSWAPVFFIELWCHFQSTLRTISIMYSHIYTSRPIWTFFVDSNIFPWLITKITTKIPHFNHEKRMGRCSSLMNESI